MRRPRGVRSAERGSELMSHGAEVRQWAAIPAPDVDGSIVHAVRAFVGSIQTPDDVNLSSVDAVMSLAATCSAAFAFTTEEADEAMADVALDVCNDLSEVVRAVVNSITGGHDDHGG